MKTINYSILRSISALVIGGLLVFWSQNAVVYLIIAVGCMFLIPGLMSVFSYFLSKKKDGFHNSVWSQVLGIGSTLFGLCLVICPVFFEKSLMYALGVILAYAGISEIVNLTAARQWARVSGGFYIIPVLIILAGIFILFNPIESANIPFIILGIGCLVYGISNLVNLVKFRHRNRDIDEATLIEEIPEDTAATEK